MDDKSLETAFQKLKEEMPVNYELKKQLRQSFVNPRGKSWLSRISVLAAAAAVIMALLSSYLLAPQGVIQKASAASLRISNFLSFIEISMGEGIGVSEYKGTVYVPVPEKGVYTYNQSGSRKILDKELAGFVRVSNDGTKLAISSGGSISIYDLKNETLQKLLPNDEKHSVYYEEPSWSPDDKRIIYTKAVFKPGKTHGFTRTDEINQIELKTGRSIKLADGSHAAMAKDGNGIFFEKEQKVIYKDLKTGVEKYLDNGRFPSISPDGNYIAYVKNNVNQREVAANAKVSETISDVWIADAVDFKTKRKVTSNFPKPFMDVNEWVKTLKPSSVPQVLQFSGQYDYYEPVWSSNSLSLYVIRNLNEESQSAMKLVRIDFSTKSQPAGDVIRRFLQALIVRDDDFAKSLMKNPPDILTVSNPRVVGYEILGSGKEGKRIYVDAEIHSAYTANPYYQYSKVRFWLSEKENGHIIDGMEAKESIQVMADDKGQVEIVRDKKRSVLFNEADIPSSFKFKGIYRFAPLAYNKVSDTVFLTLQALQDVGQSSSVRLLSYNLKTREFKLLTDITRIRDMVNVGVSQIMVDPAGRYVALDLFSDDDKAFNSHAYVYDTESGQGLELSKLLAGSAIESIRTLFWEKGYLVIEAKVDGQTMRYKYNPLDSKIEVF